MKSLWKPSASQSVIQQRASMLRNIRAFFDEHEIMEVETPLLSRFATTDVHLESLSTRFQEETYFLNTSPEYSMKRLLAENAVPIYQICKAFRDDELAQFHNPEFTILEWYRPGFSLLQLMDELERLVKMLVTDQAATDEFRRISYRQAFEDAIGLNPHTADSEQCLHAAKYHQIDIPVGMSTDENEKDNWLDWLLTQLVLPSLATEGFTFLYDYPASQAALSKIEMSEAGYPVARRFELLYGEIELANAFYELTDADEQARRFMQDNQQRLDVGMKCSAVDPHLLSALQAGLVEMSGVAVGLDRLLMVVSERFSIEQVLAFPWSRI